MTTVDGHHTTYAVCSVVSVSSSTPGPLSIKPSSSNIGVKCHPGQAHHCSSIPFGLTLSPLPLAMGKAWPPPFCPSDSGSPSWLRSRSPTKYQINRTR